MSNSTANLGGKYSATPKGLMNLSDLKDPLSVITEPGQSANGGPRSASQFDLEPQRQPNGSILLPPFPQKQTMLQQNQLEQPSDIPPIEWPEPIIRRSMHRTKSFISLTTTLSGGNLSVPSASGLTNQTQETEEMDYLQMILQASTRVYDVAIETPLQFAKNLSAKIGRDNKVYLKREDMQPVCFSFKVRGAYNRISLLTPEEKRRGVICMSAGNHAQGVALASQKLGIKATIVMPSSAPEIKVLNVRRLGATVILYGADLEEAKKECLRLSQEHGYVFIPPYDDKHIIAGQGTAAMEIIRQIRRGERLDAIFMPVGGGGLIAGVAAFIKRVQPNIKIIGVNTIDSSGMATSLQKGERTGMSSVGLFSDGTAVRLIGEETYRICSGLIDDMVLVSVDEICAAIKDVFEDTRSILEPAGALGVAGIKKFLSERGKNIRGATFVAITSGANMNFDRLRFVAERSKIGEGRECLLSCRVDERPGSFMRLYSLIHPRSVTEVSYRYCDPTAAHVYIAFDAPGGKREMNQVIEQINKDPQIVAIDITDNDMAKSHLRFLAGGRAQKDSVRNEKLYRFSFPEKQGALREFLEHLQNTSTDSTGNEPNGPWNLTLLHYRNTGGDQAKVLVGLDVPEAQEKAGILGQFLSNVKYQFVEETENPVYQHFLR